jgi:hypothetical protein
VKISRSSKARAFSRRHLVTRPVTETSRDYRWWRYLDVEPPEGFVLDTWTTHEPVYPKAAPLSTRVPKRRTLSRRTLRNRLYQNGVPKALWAGLLTQYAGRALFRMAGEPSIRTTSGFAISKAVTRHVQVTMLFLDEFGYCAQAGYAPFLAKQMSLGRKLNTGVPVVQQMPATEAAAGSFAALLEVSVGNSAKAPSAANDQLAESMPGNEASSRSALVYDYPDSRYSRVEGKSLRSLEEELMAGGPFPDSRSSRIRRLAEDSEHLLHFVAKYYLFLAHERAKNWRLEPGQSLMGIPKGCTPKDVPAL